MRFRLRSVGDDGFSLVQPDATATPFKTLAEQMFATEVETGNAVWSFVSESGRGYGFGPFVQQAARATVQIYVSYLRTAIPRRRLFENEGPVVNFVDAFTGDNKI